MNAQGLGAKIYAGYLSDLEAIGFGAGFVYEIDEKWGASADATYGINSSGMNKIAWLTLDLNGRYKFYDEFYGLAGVEFLRSKLTVRNNVGGFVTSEQIFYNSDFGFNIGGGYKYNLIDNVSVFGEAKYVIIDQSYFSIMAGLQFDF